MPVAVARRGEGSSHLIPHTSHLAHGRSATAPLYFLAMSKRRRKKATDDSATPESTDVAVAEQNAVSDPTPSGQNEDNLATSDTTAPAEDPTVAEAPQDNAPGNADPEETHPHADHPDAPAAETGPSDADTGSETETDSETETETDSAPGSSPEISPEQVVEAVLFSSDGPLPLAKLTAILGVGSARDIRKHIESLNKKYQKRNAAFRIENIAGGYQMLTLPSFNTWVRKLKQSRQDSRLSAAALETLAIVAYKQPVVRAEIEALRGVASGEMLNRLRELGLVKIVGRAEDVGRPMLYGTTRRFLEVFGLSSLDELPEVEELQSPA